MAALASSMSFITASITPANAENPSANSHSVTTLESGNRNPDTHIESGNPNATPNLESGIRKPVTDFESGDRNPNTDLEAGLIEPEPAITRPSSEAPPEYKEHDMTEPLPPYMTRVKGLIRREQPMATAMPVVKRRTGYIIIASLSLVVIIVIGIGVGVMISNNNSNGSGNSP